MESHIAYICVGSNQGNKAANCQKGINTLSQPDVSRLLEQSGFYTTEPVDYQDQDWFINIVVKIETRLDPFQLLQALKAIEQDTGRTESSIRFGPRILDLDILLYDNERVETTNLVIPHPRMHKRCFVLKPLCDIDPNIVHPLLKKKIKDLLRDLDETDQKVLPYLC